MCDLSIGVVKSERKIREIVSRGVRINGSRGQYRWDVIGNIGLLRSILGNIGLDVVSREF